MCQGLQPHLTLVFQTLQCTQFFPDVGFPSVCKTPLVNKKTALACCRTELR